MGMLDKNTIENHILSNLSVGLRRIECSIQLLTEMVEAIFYRLKTGCRWRELPTKQFFTK
jgi:transposase